MPTFFERFTKRLVSDKTMADGAELNFFFTQYKPKEVEESKMIEGIRKRLDNISFAGLFLGLSLTVSLRRYTVPSKGFPIVKVVTGCALPLAGFCFCLKKGANNALENFTKLRRKLFQNDDDQYYEHLSRKYRDFQESYRTDFDLVSEIFTRDEFDTIKINSKKDFLTLFTPRFQTLYKGY